MLSDHVIFRVDVDERIVFHGFGKVDGVQNFYAVARLLKHLSRFENKGAFRVSHHK